MGAPKVSSAIFTMSIARTTPAQKPLGLSNNTLFSLGEASAWVPLGMESRVVVVTLSSIPTTALKGQQIRPRAVVQFPSRQPFVRDCVVESLAVVLFDLDERC